MIHALQDLYKPWRSTQRGRVVRLDEEAVRSAVAGTGLPDASLRRALFARDLASPRAGLVCGHYRYARWIGERWGGESDGRDDESWSFVTVLRDPVERWLSHYFYNRANPGPLHIDAPLEEFLETPRAALLGSVQLRHLADVGEEGEPLEAGEGASHDAVRRALENLERFAVVGRLEELDGFNDAFEARFGRRLTIPRRNVNRQRPERDEAAGRPEVLERIRELCGPDRGVYEGVGG